MAANKQVRFGPVNITAAAANLFNPATLTGGVNAPGGANTYMLIKHLKVVNRGNTVPNFTLYVGATGGSASGTEVGFGTSKAVPANDSVEAWFGTGLRLDVADFLTGLASVTATLTIEGEGEVGVA